MRAAFHFLHPWWLLAWPLLLALIGWLRRARRREGRWAQLVEAHLLPLLRLPERGSSVRRGPSPWLLAGLAWSLAVVALAGPAWQRERTPAYRAPAAWVLVLDLSPSMAASDLPPDRVTRARYGIEDLIAAAGDARVGLVVFAGEPYTVTPLTSDVATIRALLDPLAPSLMPESGDQLAPALDQAGRLVAGAGGQHGQIIVLTDGFTDPAQAMLSAERLRRAGDTVDIVGVGTAQGAPLPDPRGGFVHDARGQVVLTRLPTDLLRRVAAAGGGRYEPLAQLPALITALQATGLRRLEAAQAAPGLRVAHWRDPGAWLLPPLLLLAAWLARRGWV